MPSPGVFSELQDEAHTSAHRLPHTLQTDVLLLVPAFLVLIILPLGSEDSTSPGSPHRGLPSSLVAIVPPHIVTAAIFPLDLKLQGHTILFIWLLGGGTGFSLGKTEGLVTECVSGDLGTLKIRTGLGVR